MPKRQTGILFLLLLFWFSCGEFPLYSSYIDTPNGWKHNPALSFTLDKLPSEPVNLYIHIRNNETYAYANIFLIGNIYKGDSLYQRDTLEYAMAAPSGEYLGTGYGSVKESKLWWKSEWTPPDPDSTYRVEIQQVMRENSQEQGLNSLEGIVAVGLSIEQLKTKEE